MTDPCHYLKAQTNNLRKFIFQIITGAFQASGWPGVVTVMANWFGKGRRGLIMGLWNSHTSLGNILGSLIAGKAHCWPLIGRD